MIKYLRSLNFAITLCILSMITQGYHSFYTFYNISNIKDFWGILQSLLFMSAFELWTLFYLMKGNKWMAGFYSTCYFIMNVFYYSKSFETFGWTYATAVFLSFIIPFSIFFGAEEIHKMVIAADAKEEEAPIRKEIDDLKEEVSDIKFKANWNQSINEPVIVNKKVKREENE